MRRFLASRRPSPAMAVAFVALLAALSGSALALPGKNSVDSGDIKNGAVGTKDIKNNNVRSGDVRNGTLTGGDVKNNSLTGLDINEGSLGQVSSANSANSANTAGSANTANRAASAGSVDSLVHYGKVATATTGANFDAARDAAPEIPLAQRGSFTIYGKCFKENTFNDVWSVTFIRTSVDGAVLDSDDNDFSGDPFLDVATLEADRSIHSTDVGADSRSYYASHTAEWQAMAPGGFTVVGSAGNGAKSGEITGGNGLWGAGDTCLFTGFLSG